MRRQVLGKGLDVLLPRTPTGPALLELDIERIRPSEFQPRVQFESEKLDELAASIAAHGVIQPIVVRQNGNAYEIVAGERRWRAAQRAALARIPAIVQDVSEEKMVEMALVENIQRDDLSPIEEAHAYQMLAEQFSLSQEEIAKRVGRSRTAVTNTLRLLRLPKPIQQQLLSGEISMGHARALLPLPQEQQLEWARQIAMRGLSVREVERRIQRLTQAGGRPTVGRPPTKDANLRAAEHKLEERWKTRVEIRRRGQRGQIVLYFHSEEELDRLYQGLTSEPRP